MTGLILTQIQNDGTADHYELSWNYQDNDNVLTIHGIEPVQKMITANNVKGLSHARYSLDKNMYVATLSDPDATVLAFRVDNGVIIVVEDGVNITMQYVISKYNATACHSISMFQTTEFGCINFDLPPNINTTNLDDFLVCYEIDFEGYRRIVIQRLAISRDGSFSYNRIGLKLFYLLENEGNIHEAYQGSIHGLYLLEMPHNWNVPLGLRSTYVPPAATGNWSNGSFITFTKQRLIR